MKRVILLCFLMLLGARVASAQCAGHSYSTSFPATANPISEGNCWFNGAADGTNWGNVQTSGGQAHGTVISGAPPFNDSTAVLKGVWGPNQYARATVVVTNGVDAASQQEIELRTNTTITASSITGYEFDVNIRNSQAYVLIVRWNGPLNNFTFCVNGGTCSGTQSENNFAVHNGDIVEAVTTGSLHRLLVNGVVQFSTTDGTYTNGSPGIGFWQLGGTTANLLDFGLTNFSASDSTYVAATCNLTDVNALLNGPTHTAANGDTINIPAGACTWVGGPSVVGKGISFIGSGTPSGAASVMGASPTCTATQISWAFGSGGLFTLQPTFGNATSRISCMQITTTTGPNGSPPPIGVNGTCTVSGCPNLRLDNLIVPIAQICLASDATVANVSNMFGVADHITFGVTSDVHPACNPILINAGNGSWQGVGSFGDNSWASADTMGMNGGGQTFTLENDLFNFTVGTDTDIPGASGGGARWVCRFNTFNNISSGGVCPGHGTETTGRARGGLQFEGYFNTGTCPNNSNQGCGTAWAGRSGHGMSFGNTFTNLIGPPVGNFKGIDDLNSQRVFRNVGTWGTCDGLGPAANNIPGAPPGSLPWDSTDGTIYVSGTIGTVTGGGSARAVITDAGSGGTGTLPPWTTNQWTAQNFVYVFIDTTLQAGIGIITSNTSNSLNLGDCGPCNTPLAGHGYQIRKVTACLDQPSRSNGLLMSGPYSSSPPTAYPFLVSTGASGPINQVLDPTYEADDSLPSGNPASDHTIGSDQGNLFQNNHDWYAEGINQPAQSSPTSPFNGVATTQPISSYVCTNGTLTCVFTVPSTAGFAVNGYGQAVGTAIGSPNPTFGESGQGKIIGVTPTTVSLTYPSIASNTGGAGGFISTQGSGHGTLANRPTTCTPGVAYWATDQGSWNTSGVNGPHGYANGRLFTCGAGNVWSLAYEPYTYQHPLVTGAPAPPPTNTIIFAPTSVNFGNATVGGASVNQTITISNSVSSPSAITITAIAPSGAGFSWTPLTCSAVPITINVNTSCNIQATYTATLVGTQNGFLTFTDNASGSPQSVALTGTGVAVGAPAVSLTPSTLPFPPTGLGSYNGQVNITLKNVGTATLAITSIGIQGANAGDFSAAQNCGSSLNVNAVCTIGVMFRPQQGAIGLRSASVVMVDNAAGSPHTVPLTGNAVAQPIPLIFVQ